MLVFDWILALLLGSVLIGLFARWIRAPYPSLLALAGMGLALLPVAPRLMIPPELSLALFVAPVLLDAAYDAPVRDIWKHRWLVGSLVVPAVLLTTAAVAVVAHTLVPDMPWAAAVALGAIVAPPDAAAAMAVLKQLRPPHRVTVILQGESLLNDASALLIYRLAVGAAAAGDVAASKIAPVLFYVVIGSIALGVALAAGFTAATRRIEDVPSAIILQFVSTFGIWLLAEALELSSILTVFAYAVVVARRTARVPARMRVPSFAVWETAVYVLNVIAFVLMGLQIRPILDSLDPSQRQDHVVVALAVFLTAVLIRLIWVMPVTALWRRKVLRFASDGSRPVNPPTLRGGFVVGWCGMRGLVSLAAAFALPIGFPYRELILLSAFAVVLGTLTVQGLTVNPLVRRLRLPEDPFVDREIRRAREAVANEALRVLDSNPGAHAEALRLEYRATLEASQTSGESEHDALRREVVDAQRRVLAKLRGHGEIGDEAFHRVEEELDWGELYASRLVER